MIDYSCRFRVLSFKRWIVLLLLLGWPSLLWASAPQQLLSEANSYFHQAMASEQTEQAHGLYEKALLRYERLYTDYGHGKLAYNIGNTYFRLGELGKAIVFYRRAESQQGPDDNVAHNLSYVRSLRQDQFSPGEALPAWQRALSWHRQWDMELRLQLLAAGYITFWLALLAWQRRWLPGWPLFTLLLLTLLLATSVGLEKLAPPATSGVVVVPAVVARQGDGASYEASFQEPLHDGSEFVVLEKRSRWLYVQLEDGRRCWLPSRSCEII